MKSPGDSLKDVFPLSCAAARRKHSWWRKALSLWPVLLPLGLLVWSILQIPKIDAYVLEKEAQMHTHKKAPM